MQDLKIIITMNENNITVVARTEDRETEELTFATMEAATNFCYGYMSGFADKIEFGE